MDGSLPSAQDEPTSPAADLHRPYRSFSSPALQDRWPWLDVTSPRRSTSASGSLSNSGSKGVPQQRPLSSEPHIFRNTPLQSAIPKNCETISNTLPVIKDQCKGSSHSKSQDNHCTSKRCDTLLSNASRQHVQDKRLILHAKSKRTDFGHAREKQVFKTIMCTDYEHCHAREKLQNLNIRMQEPRSAIVEFTSRLSQESRPRPFPSDTQLPWKSRCKSLVCDEGEAFLSEKRIQPEEDLGKLDSMLGSQFERLLNAIEGVTRQVQIAFEGLHERVDVLQASLEAEYDLGWKKVRDHFDQQGTPESGIRKQGAVLTRSVDSLDALEKAAQMAREDIRILTGLLIVEKDADMMLARDFQDRQAMLLKMMEPYLKKPTFEQFWHLKHGLDHCVASVLFKTSNVLARTQSMMGSSSNWKSFTEDNDEGQFRRFCRKGQKGLEAIVDWGKEKWSPQLKREFLNACKGVWELQSMVVSLMMNHQVEFLQPEPGSKLDEVTMDSLGCLSGGHFEPFVQFTIFPGFKVDDTVLIKSQVYLQPKCPVVKGGLIKK